MNQQSEDLYKAGHLTRVPLNPTQPWVWGSDDFPDPVWDFRLTNIMLYPLDSPTDQPLSNGLSMIPLWTIWIALWLHLWMIYLSTPRMLQNMSSMSRSCLNDYVQQDSKPVSRNVSSTSPGWSTLDLFWQQMALKLTQRRLPWSVTGKCQLLSGVCNPSLDSATSTRGSSRTIAALQSHWADWQGKMFLLYGQMNANKPLKSWRSG